MKNKKNIYILFPIVLLVWGAVLYQVFSLTDSDEIVDNNDTGFVIKPLKIKTRDTFAINVNYRDPFLGKMYASTATPLVKKNTSKVNTSPKPKETLVWPVIQYKGMISDTKEKNKLFMLIIDGSNHYLKIGETANDIVLKAGDKESVYVKYKGNLNLIMLEN
jgi:hypothetical protein